MAKEARSFDKFDLAYYLSGDKMRDVLNNPEDLKEPLELGENVTKYLAAINNAFCKCHGEPSKEKLMEIAALFSRIWGHYINRCTEWGMSKLIESIQKIENSNLTARPDRNIIAIIDHPTGQNTDSLDDIGAVMFALVRREPTCPMIGTRAEVRYLREYTDEEEIWQECADQMYSALLCDARPYMLGKNPSELTISIHGDNDPDMIIDAFRRANNRLSPPELRSKVRIIQEPI